MELSIVEITCTSISIQLKDCSTEKQRSLLDSVEKFAVHGFKNPTANGINCFYDSFVKSSILNKVTRLLCNQFKKRKTQIELQSISNLSIRLTRIFLLMIKGQNINNRFQIICAQIIGENSASIHTQLGKINEKKDFQDLEEGMKQMIKTLNTILFIDHNNLNYFANEPNILEQICLLMHFNCPSELKCPISVVIHNNQTVNDIKEAAFNASYYLYSISDMKQFLSKQNCIIQHQILILINFSRDINIRNRMINQKSFDSQEIISFSFKNISHAISFLSQILNRSYQQQQEIIIPGFIPILITLTKLKINENRNKIEILQMNEIKILILNELIHILINCTFETLDQLICNNKSLSALSTSIGTASGSEEHYENIIQTAFNIIQLSFFRINEEQQNQEQYNNKILKSAQEQLEEEGELEDIESHLYISSKYKMHCASFTKIAKIVVINAEKHNSNINPWNIQAYP